MLLMGVVDRLDIQQAALVDVVRGAVGQDALGDLRKLRAEGQEQQRRRDVEGGVQRCDLAGRRCGKQRFKQVGQRRQDADRREDHGADDVEEQVDDRRALCVAACADRGQHGRDAGADVLAEQDEGRAVQADQAARGERLQDADRGRGRLDDRREDHADEDAEQRVRHLRHQVDEEFGLAQRRHRVAHHAHAEEQHAETGDDLPPVVQDRLFEKDDERNADKGEQRRQRADVERDQKAGHRGADVGAHDDPDGLPQRHHAGVDEADDHDGRRRGGLDRRRDARADEHAEKAVGGQLFEDALHAVARCSLEAGAHHLHAVEEERETAEQAEYV